MPCPDAKGIEILGCPLFDGSHVREDDSASEQARIMFGVIISRWHFEKTAVSLGHVAG
jgi:hypothetical protein